MENMWICNCNCGSVEFEIKTPPMEIYVCHCSICRRFSGGAGFPVVILKNKDFRWLKGVEKVQVWKKPDADWESNFCSICGSALPGKNDNEHTFVPAGMLSDAIDGLEVKHHLFVGSKANWDKIGDTGKRHEGCFTS